MSINTLGKTDALLNIHGRRLGISNFDSNNNAELLLDGYAVAGMSGLNYESGSAAITALAGGGQSSTTPVLNSVINLLTTVATASDSVMLPPTAGNIPTGGALVVTVINTTATAAAVFPSSGDAINALAANASLAITSSGVTIFNCCSSGHWYTK